MSRDREGVGCDGRETMKFMIRLSFLIAGATLLTAATDSYKGNQCDDPKLTPAQRAGCKIWFFATAGNGRFHTYVLPQRLPVLLDWFRVLNTKERPTASAPGASS